MHSAIHKNTLTDGYTQYKLSKEDIEFYNYTLQVTKDHLAVHTILFLNLKLFSYLVVYNSLY